jgi:hypothetical protein
VAQDDEPLIGEMIKELSDHLQQAPSKTELAPLVE